MEAEIQVKLSPEQEKAIAEDVVKETRRDFLRVVTQTTDCQTSSEDKIKNGHKPFSCPRAISNHGDPEVAKYLALKRACEKGYADCYTNCNSQYVYTLFNLCKDIIGTAKKYIGSFIGLRIMVLNMEFIEVFVKEFGVEEKQITFVTSCPAKANAIKQEFSDVEVIVLNFNEFLNGSSVMAKRKFDCVVMNPPFSASQDQKDIGIRGRGTSLWNNFVNHAFNILNKNGSIAVIHPSGWRNVDGGFKKIQETILSHQIEYLNINNVDEGMRTFDAGTRYDWYIARKEKPSHNTTIIDEINEEVSLNLMDVSFIPNGKLNEVFSLLAKGDEKKVDILRSYSDYEPRKPWMQKEKGGEYIFPCINNVSSITDSPSCLWYSKINSNGHFGISKIIFGVQVSGVLNDFNGDYGLCQHCSAIVDEKKNFEQIKKALKSEKFIELMKMCDFGGNRDRYNWRVIKEFRKDFWKEFVDEKGNEI